MSHPVDKLKGKQAAAIPALLSSDTVEEAAERVGVTARTVYRWLADDDEFRAAFRDAKRALVAQASTRLYAALGDAVATLEAVMGDESAPPQARIAAAREIIGSSHKAFQVEDLQAQIEDLQRDLAALRDGFDGADDELDGDGACYPN